MSGLYRENGNSHVFIGARTGAGLGNMAMPEVLQQMEQSDVTVHGFRSTFRDWAAEATAYRNHVVEQALAHTIGNAVEAAYRRGEKLREYVFAGKSDQLWNVIPASIQTPQEIQAYTERLQRNLNSRDRWVRYLSARTLEALREGQHQHQTET